MMHYPKRLKLTSFLYIYSPNVDNPIAPTVVNTASIDAVAAAADELTYQAQEHRFKCLYDGCTKQFLSRGGRDKHMKKFHSYKANGGSVPLVASPIRAPYNDMVCCYLEVQSLYWSIWCNVIYRIEVESLDDIIANIVSFVEVSLI